MQQLAAELQRQKAILGVFDEGCMGMYNAIIDDELLNPTGVFKERLSQSALVARMRAIARWRSQGGTLGWMKEACDSLPAQTKDASSPTARSFEQCKMYIAAARIADEFGCDAIGIQYQQGLKDMVPASDLVEGSAQQFGSAAGLSRKTPQGTVRRAAAASFQRSG